ncbi:uncharacterized protein BJX67DRAFT_352423 [Aspergillus lucknowensis]|uniref:Uncharacterized protein n=1 Tax=Aspergillus lucknowensis TaxID=176173 RepID=A0ABR4LSF6_9EURO
MIPSILDRFNIHGPNSGHACLVTNPAGMSLSEAKNASWIGLFQIDVARALAAQLAMVIPICIQKASWRPSSWKHPPPTPIKLR